MITFTVYGKPQTAGSKRAFVPINKKTGQPFRRKNGNGVVVSVVDDNAKSRDWKAMVADAAKQAYRGNRLIEGPIELTLTFYRERAKGHLRSNGELRPAAPQFPTSKPDVLKLARAIEDALTKVVWLDDSQVVEERLSKRYAPPGEGPRVVVEIREIGDEASNQERFF